MKNSVIIVVLFFLLSCFAPRATAQQAPLVLAFYYAWFDQNTWDAGESVDRPAVLYESADPAAIEQHVTQARGAGIDALVQSWYGPQVENNQTETNFRVLLEKAAAQGLQAAVDVEVSSPFLPDAGAASSALSSLLASHAQHPAYLRYEGKPVIFFWRQQQYPVETWQGIRDQVDPERNTIWIAEGVDIDYQAVFDGHHLYSIAWADSPTDQLAKWGNQVQDFESAIGADRLWVATAMPGYNDTRLDRADAFAVPRRGGDYYRETWQAAVDSQPDMIIINSFNEWPEGTHIEPSDNYGNLYLEITRELVTGLKGQPPSVPVPAPGIQAAAVAEPPAQETPVPPEGPYILTVGITNVRGEPSLEADIIERLQAGTQVPVAGRLESNEWWFIENAGISGWVAAEAVEFVGDSTAVPILEPEIPLAEEPEAAEDTEVEVTPVAGSSINIPAGGVNVRSGPGLDFERIGRLEEATRYQVLGVDETGDWWLIAYDVTDDGQAWVAGAVVEFVGNASELPVVLPAVPGATPTNTPTPTPTEPIIAGSVESLDAINVRDEPSTESNVIGGFYLGETADVLAVSEDGQWWQIDFTEAPGQQAWVAAEFVRFSGDKNLVPIFGLGTPTPTPGPTDIVTPTASPTPVVIVTQQPTLAPTATSIYQATSAAILASRGTPEPDSTETQQGSRFSLGWSDIPWGFLSFAVIVGFLWYQFIWRRRQRR